MKILTKKLGKGEIKWGGVVIPRSKTALFPAPGVEFDLRDTKTAYRAKMDNQSRLRMASWFRQHRNVKPGDEVTFFKENGRLRIVLSKHFPEPTKSGIDWALEVIEAIRDGDVSGIIRLNKNGYTVEIGNHIKETRVISGTTETRSKRRRQSRSSTAGDNLPPKNSNVGDIEETDHKATPPERVHSAETREAVRHTSLRHPPVKSTAGRTLAPSPHAFALNHKPPLKYKGMRNAVDALTTCNSPGSEDYGFHYDIEYKRDGIYIERKQGPGYRTSQEEVDEMRRKVGLPVGRRKRNRST